MTTLGSQVLAHLYSGTEPGGPSALVGTLTRVGAGTSVFVPDTPLLLAPHTTYSFSLGYPEGIPILTDWFNSECDLTADGPATRERDWVSSNQGATWATGGSLAEARFLFEVVVVPEPGAGGAGAVAIAALALGRSRRRSAA